MKRVLIIAAHPDDEVLGCGGIMAKYLKKGVEFSVLFVAEGSSCRFIDIRDKQAILDIKKRTENSRKALSYLGVNRVCFNDFPCGRLDQVPIIEINKLIENEINVYKPDTVLTHSLCDANNDHRVIYNSTIMATRPGALNTVARVFTYEVLSSSQWSFNGEFSPNFFVSLSDEDVNEKWKALSFYESEIRNYPFPRSEEGIRISAMNRGMQAGCKYAEAFILVRELLY